MSISQMKIFIQDYIRDCFMAKNKLHLLPTYIPDHTLNCYTSLLKCQSIFNIFTSVTNKTEARTIAESSMRSSISFALVVATNHFIPNATRTIYHPRLKDLDPDSAELWEMAQVSFHKMIGSPPIKTELLPILPNLVTSTDEVTIFASTIVINQKEKVYICARPDEIKNETCDSGKRNNYNTTLTGDAHARGVRIVINNTFTAGGLSAPIYVVVYGNSRTEMPGASTITIPIPGLAIGSHQDIFASSIGYLTFVRADDSQDCQDDTSSSPSKESIMAMNYREKIYYPFIHKIRTSRYGWDGDVNHIPPHLQAVSWMDGCSSQLKCITTHANMLNEDKLLITCCKHSASRTAVEQAADTGSMFKHLKKIIRETDSVNASNSMVYSYLSEEFDRLEVHNIDDDLDNSNCPVLVLPAHKKQAIKLTLAKIPVATSRAYGDEVIKKAFVLNGQLDPKHKVVPSFKNLLNTYRGNVAGTCLENRQAMMDELYEECFTRGIISEESFERMGVPADKAWDGTTVDRNFPIRQENRQRAKCLSNNVQKLLRKQLIMDSRMVMYNRAKSLFDKEELVFNENKKCEMSFVKIFKLWKQHNIADTITNDNTTPATENPSTSNNLRSILPTEHEGPSSFQELSGWLTYEILTKYQTKVSKSELRSFLMVRSERSVTHKGKITYLDVPNSSKAEIMKLVIDVKDKYLNIYSTLI